MRCNICNAICNDLKDTVFDEVSNKFITTCNNCTTSIKEVTTDFNLDDEADLNLLDDYFGETEVC